MGCSPSKAQVATTVGSSSSSKHSKRRQQQVDFTALKRIDEHVRKTPPAARQSMQSLATYLGSATTTDLEKIRAVYKWITANISYDTDYYFGAKKTASCDAESVLKTGSSVCEGFASLSLSLCQLLSVDCVKISGYSKGFGYDPMKPLTTDKDTDHAWNAVKLNGEWRFIESTWGAGHVTKDHKFVREETDFYFLTDPEVFIETHFPYMNSDLNESKKWQLLESPIDLNTFHSRVKRDKACIEHQVELVSHRQALIDADGEVTLKFRGTGKPLTSFSAKFVNPSTGERMDSGRYIATVLDHRTNEATVTARPPTSGILFELEVFGTTMEKAKSMGHLVSYRIRDQSRRSLPVFPDSQLHYGLHGNPENFGFPREFRASEGFRIKVDGGDRAEFALKIPTSTPVSTTASLSIADGSVGTDGFCFVGFNSGSLTICLRLGYAANYKLELYCKERSSKGNTLPLFAKFLIECVSPMKQPNPYPASYTSACTEQVHLECPRDGQLPANSDIRFRLSSPTLKKLLVQDNIYSKSKAGFDFVARTGGSGADLIVYGTADGNASAFTALYKFTVV